MKGRLSALQKCILREAMQNGGRVPSPWRIARAHWGEEKTRKRYHDAALREQYRVSVSRSIKGLIEKGLALPLYGRGAKLTDEGESVSLLLTSMELKRGKR